MARRLGITISALLLLAAPASAHKGNPNYESTIRSVAPQTAGLVVSVLNGDDRLELSNRTGKDVVIEGYNGEPYARVLADGTVQVNQHSPAAYLNTERDGKVTVPDSASEKAKPAWKTVDESGKFEWHDHRMHWMGSKRPQRVTDPDRRTKVFDWAIPIAVGATAGDVKGDLYWRPTPDGGLPIYAWVGIGLLVIVVAVFGIRASRRRAGGEDGGREAPEAW